MNLLPQAPAFGSAVRAGAPVAAPKVLYAEDDPIIRRVSEFKLSQHGYAVTTVKDGQQAWEALQDGRFDLLVTDNEMPRLSGLQLIGRLREARMELPVILASGYVARASEAELEELRLATALAKPFTPGELLDAVEHALDGAPKSAVPLPPAFAGMAESQPQAGAMRHWGINE